MHRRSTLRILGSAALGTLATSTVSGDSSGKESNPGGPWLTEKQQENLQGFHDYDELMDRLRQIEHSSQGRVSIQSIGTSNQGREIPMASVGDGEIDVMLASQQHGHEPTGTETLLRLVRNLASNGGKGRNNLLDEVTVHIIVRGNPDGAEPDVFTRFNVDENAPPRDTGSGIYTDYSQAGIGWDINRYHWFDWEESSLYQNFPEEYPTNPVPEAQVIVNIVDEIDPLWFVDIHNQLSYVMDNGDLVTNSVLWPLHEDVPAETRELGKQLSRLAYDKAHQFGNSTPTRFPGGGTLGVARNSHGVEGVASMLLETRGHIGQKSQGQLVRNELAIISALIEATADGSVYEVNPALADEIPLRGNQYVKDLPRRNISIDEWVSSEVSTALLGWDILNDVVACSVDERFLKRLPVQIGDNLLVRNELNNMIRPLVIARTHNDGGERTVRMGRNARGRFYSGNVPSLFDASVQGHDLGEWSLMEVRGAYLSWDILNDEKACSISETFQKHLSIAVGDEIVVQNHKNGRERVYEVARTHTEGERRIRMGYNARSRFYESDESVPSSFVGQLRPN